MPSNLFKTYLFTYEAEQRRQMEFESFCSLFFCFHVCDQPLLDIVSEPGQACVKLAPKYNLPHNCHKSQLPVNVISLQINSNCYCLYQIYCLCTEISGVDFLILLLH